jgi:hypothetical protein
VSCAPALHAAQFSKIAIKQINLGNVFIVLVFFGLFTVASIRSESVGAGGQTTGSDTASIAFARRTTSCCPAQSFPLNHPADPPQPDCPAAMDDLQKGPAMAVKLVERNLTLSLPFCKGKKLSGWPVVQNFMVFPPNPGPGVTLPASTAEHG